MKTANEMVPTDSSSSCSVRSLRPSKEFAPVHSKQLVTKNNTLHLKDHAVTNIFDVTFYPVKPQSRAIDKSPPINEIIQAHVVPRLLQFLSHPNQDIQVRISHPFPNHITSSVHSEDAYLQWNSSKRNMAKRVAALRVLSGLSHCHFAKHCHASQT